MKKRLLIFALVTAILLPQMVVAQTATTVDGYGPYQTGVGGEFTLLADAALSAQVGGLNGYVPGLTSNIYQPGTFQTFCIEGGEYIYSNTTFKVVVNDKAVNGGLSASVGGDPLSVGSAYLYYLFATDTWPTGLTYNYETGRAGSAGTSADLLQRAFWWLEGEEGEVYNASNPYEAKVVDIWGTDAQGHYLAMADNNGQYPVKVLNLYLQDGRLAQDQLILETFGQQGKVPEPTTMLLCGLGFAGAGLYRRMRRRK